MCAITVRLVSGHRCVNVNVNVNVNNLHLYWFSPHLYDGTFLLGPPCARGCPAYGLVPFVPRRSCLRLILFCTCPPLCTGVLWLMPAWVCRDVQSVFLLSFCFFAFSPLA